MSFDDESGSFDDDFLRKLSDSEREDFFSLYQEKKEDVDREGYRRGIKNEIENYEEHLELITATVSAFPQGDNDTETGFEFAFTEPLVEQGVENGDVLLANIEEDGVYLCIVECKGGTYSSSWANELSGIADTINTENKQVLKKQLNVPNKEIKHIQLVLLAKSSEALHAQRQLNNGDLPRSDASKTVTPYDSAIWGCDIFADSIHHTMGDVAVKDLSNAVKSSIDYADGQSPIEYILSDHVLIPLREVIFRIVRRNKVEADEHEMEFEEEDFHELFVDKLQIGCSGETREELVKERSEWILEKAQEIGIVTDSDSRVNSDRDYRILFRGSNPPTAKDATQDKYIEHESKKKTNEKAFELAKEDFDLGQSGLEEF